MGAASKKERVQLAGGVLLHKISKISHSELKLKLTQLINKNKMNALIEMKALIELKAQMDFLERIQLSKAI
jgi:hypothetical protein